MELLPESPPEARVAPSLLRLALPARQILRLTSVTVGYLSRLGQRRMDLFSRSPNDLAGTEGLRFARRYEPRAQGLAL